jgi:hypothetical protein
MSNAQQQAIDHAASTLDDDVEKALKSLASAGLGPMDGYKLLHFKLGMSYEEAKRRVIFSAAWAHMREATEHLHDLAESVADAEAMKSSGRPSGH